MGVGPRTHGEGEGRGWEPRKAGGRGVAGAELRGRIGEAICGGARCVRGGRQELSNWGLGARRAALRPGLCRVHT